MAVARRRLAGFSAVISSNLVHNNTLTCPRGENSEGSFVAAVRVPDPDPDPAVCRINYHLGYSG